MATHFTKIVLLFAVAISQTIGGVSCCCFGRAVTESLLASIAGDTVRDNNDACLLESLSSCPKCAARKAMGCTDKFIAREKKCCQIPHLCADDQCRCVKLDLSSNAPSDPVSVHSFSHPTAGLHSANFDDHSLALCRLQEHTIPPRYGGKSWQSIACVWNN